MLPLFNMRHMRLFLLLHISDRPFALPYPCNSIQGGVRHLTRMACIGASAAPAPRTVIGPPMVSDGIRQSREHGGGPARVVVVCRGAVGAAGIPVHQWRPRWYHPHDANARTNVFSRRRLRDVAAAPVHAAHAIPHEYDAAKQLSRPATGTATCPSSIPSSIPTSRSSSSGVRTSSATR